MSDTLFRSTGDLPALRAALCAGTDLSSLADYLRYRELGPRSRMAEPLAAFAAQAAGLSFSDRQVLVRWIGEPWIAQAGIGPTSTFHWRRDPAFRAVVEPTLGEWLAREPEAAEPMLLTCLWDDPAVRGLRLHCLRAVVASHPDLVPARRAFVRAAMDLVGFAQHEWPGGYLGDPVDDLELLTEAEAALAGVPDEWRRPMMQTLGSLADLARDAAGQCPERDGHAGCARP